MVLRLLVLVAARNRPSDTMNIFGIFNREPPGPTALERAQDLLEQVEGHLEEGEVDEARDRLAEVHELAAECDEKEILDILHAAGDHLRSLGESADALSYFYTALVKAEGHPDAEIVPDLYAGRCYALIDMATTAMWDGEDDEAESWIEQARAEAKATGDIALHAEVLIRAAKVEQIVDPWRGSDYLDEADALLADLTDERRRAELLEHIGDCCQRRSTDTASLGFFDQAIEIVHELGDTDSEIRLILKKSQTGAHSTENWGFWVQQANERFAEALALAEASDDAANVSLTLFLAGQYNLDHNESALAEELFTDLLQRSRDIDDPLGMVRGLFGLGQEAEYWIRTYRDPRFMEDDSVERKQSILVDLRQKAITFYSEALEVAGSLEENAGWEHILCRRLAWIRGQQGETDTAVEFYNRSLEACENNNDLLNTLDAATMQIEPQDANEALELYYDNLSTLPYQPQYVEKVTSLLTRLGHRHWQAQEYGQASAQFSTLIEWLREAGGREVETEQELAQMLLEMAHAGRRDEAAAAADLFVRALVLAEGQDQENRVLEDLRRSGSAFGSAAAFAGEIAVRLEAYGMDELSGTLRGKLHVLPDTPL